MFDSSTCFGPTGPSSGASINCVLLVWYVKIVCCSVRPYVMKLFHNLLTTEEHPYIHRNSQPDPSNNRHCWPRGLRRRSAAACWLGLRVPIRPETWMLSVVSVVCFLIEVSASGWSLFLGRPAKHVCVSVSVIRCNNNPVYLQWISRSR